MAANRNHRKNNANVSTGALAAIYTLALIVAALALLAISSLLLLPGMMGMGDPRGGFENNAFISALEGNLLLRLALSGLNVLLSIYLLFTYVKDYLRLRASFTLGIIAFLFSFLLYALSSFPLVRVTMGPYGIASSLSFVPMLFSAIGLLIFAKLSNQ
ncbi:Uncharacterised protein [Candidatus Anstonella stagnisolia]|nr:Uncharacterised protein [Candidatus Anstonella stagnisolia]